MLNFLSSRRLTSRLRASSLHLLISLLVAAAVAVLVLHVWYPGDYSVLAGGQGLFWLVVSVDVVLGPVLTGVVFNLRKPRAELVRDLAVIAALQVSALGYGLHTVYQVRPVALVYEIDRFRVVTAVDVKTDELPLAAPEFRTLPFSGPMLLGARRPQSADERLDAISQALAGYDVGQRPTFWQPYDKLQAAVLERARPVAQLFERYPDAAQELSKRLAELGLTKESALFLPVVARAPDFVVLLRPTAEVAGFARFDGFF